MTKDPLHGVTLEMMVQELVAHFGWAELGERIAVKCFTHEPSVASSLKFLRRTPWARSKVEGLYGFILREQKRAARDALPDLESIASATIAVVAGGGYTSPAGVHVDVTALVSTAIAGTHVVVEHAPAIARARTVHSAQRIEVTRERTDDCARRLLAEGARRVALLNFANGVRPGGGFLHGARAQEEDLCRCSALYACLTTPASARFYLDNESSGSALVSDALVVSPSVPFFREPSFALLEEPFVATVITGAAPDRAWLSAQVDSGRAVADEEITAVFARRTRAVLAAAHEDGADALVLGAWGCGAFGNEPERVASAFADALADIGGAVPRVVFAVWSSQLWSVNYHAFSRHFAIAS